MDVLSDCLGSFVGLDGVFFWDGLLWVVLFGLFRVLVVGVRGGLIFL